jgi:mediator of replication checkpoint protein 1
MADQPVFIEHTEQKTYTKAKFFDMLKSKLVLFFCPVISPPFDMNGDHRPNMVVTGPASVSSSDPIQQFSSSPTLGGPSHLIKAPPSTTQQQQTPGPIPSTFVPDIHSDDEEDLPTVDVLVGKKPVEVQKKEQLAEIKRRALAERRIEDDGSDDGLEIVQDEMEIRRSGGRKGSMKGHKRMQIGRLGAGRVNGSTTEVLKLASSRPVLGTGKAKEGEVSTQQQLNRVILEQVNREKEREINKREEEWVKRGGRANSEAAVKKEGGLAEVFGEYAKKAVLGEVMQVDSGDEEEGSDEEWERGSGGSEPPTRESISPELVEENQPGTEILGDGLSQRDKNDDEDVDDVEIFRLRGLRRVRPVVDSDNEDESGGEGAQQRNIRSEQLQPQEPYGHILVPDTSFSTTFINEGSPLPDVRRTSVMSICTSEETENENDKENDTRRMWDKSEDKENKAVVRYSPFTESRRRSATRGSLFELEESLRRGLSMSPGMSDEENEGEEIPRKPFEVLKEDAGDDPFISPVKSTFARRLASASQSLSPSLMPVSGDKATLSEHSVEGIDETNVVEVFKPKALEPGFSQLFGAGTVANDNRFGSPFSENQVSLEVSLCSVGP